MIREFTCDDCGDIIQISGTKQQWRQYDEGRLIIQHIFPELSIAEREIMISGICKDCFNNLFN